MTPSFMGLMATMLPGVRPSISLASLPTASTSPVFLLMATMEGSLTTMPLPRAYTKVLAVPRSMARSLEKMLNSDLRLCRRVDEWNPLDDIRDLALSNRCHYRANPVASVRMGGRVHNSMGRTPSCPQTKVPVPREVVPPGPPLLDHDLFLDGSATALGILRRNRDQTLARRKGRHKVVKAAIDANHG